MSVCFGEIQEKVSRAFWDEEDEFDDDSHGNYCPERSCKIVWMTDKNILQRNFDVLLIVDGAFMKGVFEQGVVAKADPIARILDVKSAKKCDVMGQIFFQNDKALVCLCEESLDVTNTYAFTREVFPLMARCREVVALTSRSAASYLHHRGKELPMSFLRRLQTDAYRGDPVCERLEQPNIVSGVPAQVLSWCQAHNLPAVLFVCYSESDEIDSMTTKPVAQLLSKMKCANLRLDVANLHSVYSAKGSSLLYM
ncbi:proteasome assembly chaperone 1 [Bacillus rossius redtenbacheri]|uniref:proteasome assembly chaperone 1 n=1 Tax=Bacillus rossius redtenbacheri TaxID=93214 RepID=UPI002FDD6025